LLETSLNKVSSPKPRVSIADREL